MTEAADIHMRFAASSSQGALLARRVARRPHTLICLLNYSDASDQWHFAAAIGAAVSGAGGSIRWQGRIHQPLNNAVFNWQEAVLLDLPEDLYDEITLMQYKSGPEFSACFELRAMDGAAAHRRAGLAHCMFAVTEPAKEFILG